MDFHSLATAELSALAQRLSEAACAEIEAATSRATESATLAARAQADRALADGGRGVLIPTHE